jgi:hypothetical protein
MVLSNFPDETGYNVYSVIVSVAGIRTGIPSGSRDQGRT